MRDERPAAVGRYLAAGRRGTEQATEQAVERSVDETRFVSLDCETTGLNPKTDRLVEIGAVAVQGGQIVLDDAFETLVRTRFNTASVTVHGITREETRGGLPEDEALEGLLDYLGGAVIVGHHIRHDIETIDTALDRNWGIRLYNLSLDTMGLALLLERDGAFAGRQPIQNFSLDALCERFGLKPYDRHTAAGDAFLAAHVFLRLLKAARRSGRTTLKTLLEEYQAE